MGKILIIHGADFSQYKVDSIKMPYNGPVEIPQISIDNDTQLCTLIANENLDIYYTTDNTIPSLESTLYTEPFTIDNSSVVKSITSNGKTVSLLPKISVVAKMGYASGNTLQLSSSVEGTIRYTTDGSTPSSTSTAYDSVISISDNQTIKAAVYNGTSLVSEISSIQITD